MCYITPVLQSKQLVTGLSCRYEKILSAFDRTEQIQGAQLSFSRLMALWHVANVSVSSRLVIIADSPNAHKWLRPLSREVQPVALQVLIN